MSTMRDTYITLPSNVKSNTDFEYNTISNYKTILNTRLEFPNDENWEVGLSEIGYNKSWFNVREKFEIGFFGRDGESITPTFVKSVIFPKPNIILVEKDNVAETKSEANLNKEPITFPLYINPGYYQNVSELCDAINEKFKDLGELCKQPPRIIFDKYDHHVTIIAGQCDGTFFPDFGEEVNKILGLIDDDNLSLQKKASILNERIVEDYSIDDRVYHAFTYNKYRGSRCSEINAGCNSLFIYSNIVEHTFVGNAFAQLLRTVEVPEHKKFGEFVTKTYDSPHFMPLQTKTFDTIELDIKDDTGERIPFEFGRVSVKLYFRKHE